jgi:hypothetical protein
VTTIAPDKIRFPFFSQRPGEDACGAFVLQMLTGRRFDEVAALFNWAEGDLRRAEWANVIDALKALGWEIAEPRPASNWADVQTLAIVHVKPDHFMLYDGEAGVFYDPWEWQGPQAETSREPLTFLPVKKPA